MYTLHSGSFATKAAIHGTPKNRQADFGLAGAQPLATLRAIDP